MKKLLSFFIIFVIKSVNSDLVEDAQTQIENLKASVQGNIDAAIDEFTEFYASIEGYSYTVLTDGSTSIDQVYEDVSNQLKQIKDLAAQDKKDISRCTGGREQMINRLPTELKERIRTCIATQKEDAVDVVESSKYLVDITINEVHNLEFQINLCGTSETCISPILTQIEKAIVSIPQKIQEEIVTAETLINKLLALVQECGDDNVSDFTGYVTELIEQIADCADKVIDFCNGSCILPVCCV